MKWLGGAYLVWLGIQVWRAPPIGVEICRRGAAPRGLVAVPPGRPVGADQSRRALLFFAAFLPQFIDPARSLVLQFVVMAGTFAVIEMATEVFIASMAHRISPWLRRVGRRSIRPAAACSWPSASRCRCGPEPMSARASASSSTPTPASTTRWRC